MSDLQSGAINLEQFRGAVFVGGFSYADVLDSAKGWAGAFLYNEKANTALQNFFDREDTLSIGICNGCQLFMELDLINPEHAQKGSMMHNDTHKHECGFVTVTIPKNNSARGACSRPPPSFAPTTCFANCVPSRTAGRRHPA